MRHPTRTGMLGVLLATSMAVSSMAVSSHPVTAENADQWSRDLGECFASANGHTIARACTAVIEAGTDTPAHLARAHLKRAGTRLQEGADGEVRIDRDGDRALADFNAAVRLDPTLVSAYDARARAWQDKREFDRAIADCDEAIRLRRLETGNPDASPALHHLFMQRGDIGRDKGALDRALADFEAALAAAPHAGDRALALRNRGLTYQMMRQFDRALADFTELISQRWDVPRSYAGRGLVHLQMGNLRQAWDDFASTIGRSEHRGALALGLHGRGVARAKLGDERGGHADIMAAEAIDERLSQQLRAIGEGLLNGGAEKARARFDVTISTSPDRLALAVALYGRGAMRNRGGDKTMGGRDQAAAVVLDPDVVKSAAKLGFN